MKTVKWFNKETIIKTQKKALKTPLSIKPITMGRIKTQLIKRTARKLFAKHHAEVKLAFDENKAVVTNFLQNPNKKMRNIVAGYLSRLFKQQQEGSKPRRRVIVKRSERSNYTSRQR